MKKEKAVKLGAMLAVAGVLAVPIVIELATPSSTATVKAARLDTSIHVKSARHVATGEDADQPLVGPIPAFELSWLGPDRFSMWPRLPLGVPGASMPGLDGLSPPSPRAACEEDVDRLAGMASYTRSRLRLSADQKIAWQKVEQAAETGVGKLRDLCLQLPSQPAEPPALLDALDFAEKQMMARAELLRAVRDPVRALYETMSPDQKAVLRPRPFPPLSAHPGERL